MQKFPINIKTRLKQLFCNHETVGISWYFNGMNSKLGWHYVTYECKCGLCVSRWELDGVHFKKGGN